jgi:hypothetical protein
MQTICVQLFDLNSLSLPMLGRLPQGLFAGRIARDVNSAGATIAVLQTCLFSQLGGQQWMQLVAEAAQLFVRVRRRKPNRGGQDSGAGPRCFTPWFGPVDNAHFPAMLHQIVGQRQTDYPSANN